VKLGLGTYPTVSLASARKKARNISETRSAGLDPQEARRIAAEQQPRRQAQYLWTDGACLACAGRQGSPPHELL